MFGVRSARGRAIGASLTLLLFLVSVAIVATLRTQSDRSQREALEQRAAVVAALENARAQFYRGATLLTAAVFAEDAVPFIDSYRQAQEVGDSSLEKARSGLIAIGETDQIAALDSFAEQMGQVREDVDAVLVFSVTADRPTRVEVGLQYYPQMWPRIEAMMGDLGALSSEQQAELVAAGAAADRASHTTLALLIGFSMFAFLGGAATLSVLVVSVVRPLASLQESARAVASGNLEARAKVAGPEEVASLARDFNEMTDTLVERSALLEESEGRFRNVLEVSRDLTYKLNLQTRTYDYVSPSALRLTGFTFEELTDMGLRGTDSRVHPDDLKQYKVSPDKLSSPTSQPGPASTIEYRWKCKDGEYRWFSDNRALIRDEDGQPLATVGTIRDITEWKLAEEALRESGERLRSLFEAMTEGVILIAPDGQIVQANPAAEHILGLRRSQIEGRSYVSPEWEILRPDGTPMPPEEMAGSRAMKEKRLVKDVVMGVKRPDGQVAWINVSAAPLINQADELEAVVGTFADISDRKAAEEALRESEARYRGIFESIQDIFYRTDAVGIITEISPSIERFGYTREALIGTQVLEVYEDPEERSRLLKALLEQGDVADHEIRLKTGDGRLISTSVSAHILRGPDGTPIGIEGILRDISDRKAAEEALREQARRDPLTGVLNHGAIVDEMRSLISAGEDATPWAVAMIDVDHLKVMNDTYGHQAGDAMLVAVATALSRDDALVGRYGGDEFVAILRGADRAAAENYRKEATDALVGATVTDPQTGESVPVEASIGLAIYPEDGSTLADLIKVSDSAMYAAKRQRPVRRPSPRKHAPDRKAA